MSDPFAIFASTPGKQGTLKALWPELHACLSRTDGPKQERFILCVLGDCPSIAPRTRAIARISVDGPPGCAAHVLRLAIRPGGWPLERPQ